MARWVLHVDMDQFLAAVEVLRRPELAGLPVVVGGRGDPTERAVVSTASYEARAFGIRSGMALRIAVRRCPDAVFLPVDFPVYEEASARVMEVLRGVRRHGGRGARLGRGVRRRRDRRPGGHRARPAGGRARRHPAALLDRDRRHQGARQDRDRPRQAARGVPADPGQLVRGDGRPPDEGAVGDRQPDRAAPRGTRHPHRPRPGDDARRTAGQRSSDPTPAPTSAGSAAARAARRSTTPRGSRAPTAGRRRTSTTSRPPTR